MPAGGEVLAQCAHCGADVELHEYSLAWRRRFEPALAELREPALGINEIALCDPCYAAHSEKRAQEAREQLEHVTAVLRTFRKDVDTYGPQGAWCQLDPDDREDSTIQLGAQRYVAWWRTNASNAKKERSF